MHMTRRAKLEAVVNAVPDIETLRTVFKLWHATDGSGLENFVNYAARTLNISEA
jgi:hypothetical protein